MNITTQSARARALGRRAAAAVPRVSETGRGSARRGGGPRAAARGASRRGASSAPRPPSGRRRRSRRRRGARPRRPSARGAGAAAPCAASGPPSCTRRPGSGTPRARGRAFIVLVRAWLERSNFFDLFGGKMVEFLRPFLKKNAWFPSIAKVIALQCLRKGGVYFPKRSSIYKHLVVMLYFLPYSKIESAVIPISLQKGCSSSNCLSRVSSGTCSPFHACLLYTSPSPRDKRQSRMPSSA